MRKSLLLAVVIAAVLILLPLLTFAAEPRVEQFAPQGEVKQVRQAQARFSAAMVSFGDPGLADPFEVKCSVPGKGRWVDSRNWVYDFDRDLPGGVAGTFILRPDLKTLAGEALAGQREFAFTTGGPAIMESEPYEGEYSRISEDAMFFLTLDAAPRPESVLERVFFSVEGIQERINVIIPGEEERPELLAYFRKAYRYLYDEIPDSGALPDGRHLFFVRAARAFPNKAVVKLVWGKGVQSADGVATTQDQVLTFKVRPEFLVTFSCPRENTGGDCIPCLDMAVEFSAPVKVEFASQIRLKGTDRVYEPKISDRSDSVQQIKFIGPFPENERFTLDLPPGLTDDAGRVPANREKYPLAVATGYYPPLAKFSSRFGILEKADPVLPVTLRHLEPEIKARLATVHPQATEPQAKGLIKRFDDEREIIDRLRRVRSVGRSRSLLAGDKSARSLEIPRSLGKEAFEVAGIPLGKPGLYLVELESPVLGAALLGTPRTLFVPTAALVTNLSVHLKKGRQSSLVWVTTLDKAEPVPEAAVSIRNAKGEILWQGRTDANGLAVVNLNLDAKAGNPYLEADRAGSGHGPAIGKHEIQDDAWMDYPQLNALDSIDYGLFVFARTADDLSFVHSSWDKGIENWRFGLGYGGNDNPLLAHTVFDRPLFRAGETVSMKHYIRRHDMNGFLLPDKGQLPAHAIIRHQGGTVSEEGDEGYDAKIPLEWDKAAGVAESVWTIPGDARLGTYTVTFEHKDIYYNEGGSFRVEEFRIPLLKGSIQPVLPELAAVSAADLDLQVSYLSGGGASGLPIKLRAMVEPRHVSFDDFEGYSFGTGGVKEGREGRADESDESARSLKKTLPARDLTLGAGGALRTTIDGIPSSPMPRTLLAEVEFRDPNGEIQTISRSLSLWPAGLVLGLKPDNWTSVKDSLTFSVAAVDPSGRPLPNVKIDVNGFQRKRYSHRRRHIGGFYSYEHDSEVIRVGRLATGTTDEKGILHCHVEAPVSGELILQAEAVDAGGRQAVTQQAVWVAGGDDWWFEAEDSDRIDLLPEKKSYEPGETAVFQARMPFREATALVTVEREGVIDAYVQKVSGTDAVVRVPVKGTYAPNVFVSALCVRGRATEFAPTALVDLGRPAFKMGLAEIRVDWQRHALNVDVASSHNTYAVRDKAPVTIRVRTADGTPLTGRSEAAVAVVDEGLLELMPNDSWDLLTAMMGRRSNEVETATAQGQVIGRRHYGLKALPQGGGGGAMATREMFDTLVLWQGRVPLDADGRASLEVPLNDSLTSFRIVAVADNGVDRFGTGYTTVRTTKDLMVFSGLPPVVREGDRFRAGFTVRNASDRKMKIGLTARLRSGDSMRELEEITCRIKPGEADDIGWTVETPAGADGLEWEVTAREKDAEAGDAIRVRQKVVPAVPVRVVQATLERLDKPLALNVARPAEALPGKGGMAVRLSPTLAGAMPGVERYMREYPFGCMEQRVSRAIALNDETLWKGILADLPRYLDDDGLVKYFPVCAKGSDVLTAYLVAIADEAGREIPADLKKRLEKALAGFVEGRVIRHSALPTADVSIRKLAALEALSRSGQTEPDMLGSITIEPDLWPTSAVLDWISLLARVPQITDSVRLREEAMQTLRTRLNLRGTSLGFSTEAGDNLWWLMVSGDVNAVRTILVLFDLPEWQADLPRLVRGAMARQRQGRWNTTTANAWGVLAMARFSRAFEKDPVAGLTTALLDGKEAICNWTAPAPAIDLMLDWPDTASDMTVRHDGGGAPWATIRGLAAIPITQPLSSGYRIVKSITPVEQKEKGRWLTGDVIRVRLEVEAQADMTWVAVADPIPAGAVILGTGLGRDSRVMTGDEKFSGGPAWPTFEERSFEAFRAYYEWMPKGNYSIEYTLRLNQAGEFQMPPTRAEALYAPEMFGEIPNVPFTVAGDEE